MQHAIHALYVNSSRSNIGSDQRSNLLGAELSHGPVPLLLVHAAMEDGH